MTKKKREIIKLAMDSRKWKSVTPLGTRLKGKYIYFFYVAFWAGRKVGRYS